ncbi:MAG: MMPL family transporter [Lachnospiraceae bacterium]|nr:MMPL family transporter [Lachnospiraceae bacterium]
MRKLYETIVNHKKKIIAIFLVAAIISVFGLMMVAVDYDMNDYLPAESPSTIAIDVMEEEFSGGIPNARVMVRGVTIPQALEIKAKIEAATGVIDVTWLDDSEDVTVPESMIDRSVLDNYYIGDTAIFSVTIDNKLRVEGCDAIREIIGEDGAMTGAAVSTAVATVSTINETILTTVVAIIFVLFVLTLTLDSWSDPFVVLGGLGIAILINGGTNIIFGTISFVTNAAGNILQLAVSLDYSVFLIHRYEECRRKTSDNEEAMVEALDKSTTSILSSGLTTVIGFLALCLMRFRIGPDLGLALAKGVVLSLVTVFVFMPCLILIVQPLSDKLRHRHFIPSFERFGRFVRSIMIPMACVFAAVIVPAYLASNSNSYYYGASHMFGPDTQLGSDTAKIEEVFGKNDTYVLLVPKGNRPVELALSKELHTVHQVTGIISYVDSAGVSIPKSYLDEDTLKLLESDNYSRLVISVKSDFEGEEAFALVKKIRTIAEKYYPGKWYLAGQGVSTYDLMDTITADMLKANLVAIAAVFLIMVFLMKDIVLPVILVLSIETAIWINVAIPYFQGNRVFYIDYLIISTIQLGATVDYAILLSDRYREMRAKYDRSEAIVETLAAVTVSIMTSGSALIVVGMLLGVFTSNLLLSQLGYFIGKGGIFSVVIVLFVLPGLLYLLDGLFIKREHIGIPHHGKETER